MSKPFSDTVMNVDVKNFTVNNQNIDNRIELSSWSCRRDLFDLLSLHPCRGY